MSIDLSTHSLFGASKAAADLLVQEYGRYFDMPTVCFRGGCLTGPQHAGAKLHGFLAYLMKCAVTGTPYTVFGYEGKQVRDNIHSADVVAAFEAFARRPRAAAVYNIGGGRDSNCSMLRGDRGLRADRRARARVGDGAGAADRRPPLVDLRPRARSRPTTRSGSSSTTSRRRCARSTTSTSSAGSPDLAQPARVDVVDEAARVLVRDERAAGMRSIELRTSASRSVNDSGDHGGLIPVSFCSSLAEARRR